MTRFVVDASIAVKWLTYEDLSDEAAAFARARNQHLIAPQIILAEVANALVRKAIRGDIAGNDALSEYKKLPLFFDEMVAVEDVIPTAMDNAYRLRHPVYDLIYLEVALRYGTTLITADRRLSAKISGTEMAKYLLLLSDWRSA